MNVDVQNIDQVRKKVEVILPVETIENIREEIIRELGKEAKIKGFRQGKVPKPIIVSYYKEYIDDELRRRIVDRTMVEALSSAQVMPLTEPVVEFIEDEGIKGYHVECEVMPEFELPEYKGIEVEVDPVRVSDEEIDRRIDGLREMHVQMVPKAPGAVAEGQDFLYIRYEGFEHGKPVKDLRTENYPVQLGGSNLMPEFESALVGMKAGEEKDLEITFPDDYPDKSYVGKTILFKITVNEIKQKVLPEISDEFAKDLNFDNLESMREGLRTEIGKEKQGTNDKAVSEKILDSILASITIPVPRRLLEKRIDAALEDMKSRFDSRMISSEEENVILTSLRQEYEKREERGIRIEMLLEKIAEKEGITADENDVVERMKRVAESAKRPYEEVREFYERNDFMEGLRTAVQRDKTLDFLRSTAVIKEKA